MTKGRELEARALTAEYRRVIFSYAHDGTSCSSSIWVRDVNRNSSRDVELANDAAAPIATRRFQGPS